MTCMYDHFKSKFYYSHCLCIEKKIIIVVYCCLLTNGNSEFKAFDTKQCHVICTMPKVLWYYEYSTSIVYVRDLVYSQLFTMQIKAHSINL